MYNWLPLNSPDDFQQLKNHISVEYAPKTVADRLKQDFSSSVKAVLIEHRYVDKDYRSTFYHFYAKKGQRYRSDCVRLHFFDAEVNYDPAQLRLACADGRIDDHYFGYMVLRPTGIGTIGRSIISPDVRKGVDGFVVVAKHKVHLLGYRLTIDGFPSMDQHVDISVCAHTACWSILRHYSERYNIYREFHVHDITLMAQPYNPGGLVPSNGLTLSHAERVFQEAGTFPVQIARNNEHDVAFYAQLIAYVESGFPLFAAMHKRAHAIAVVGFQWNDSSASSVSGPRYSWDAVDSLVVVDDNHFPYLSIPSSSGSPYSAKDIDGFIVALPEKIFYPADAVDRLARTLYKLNTLVKLPDNDQVIIRYFVTTGSALRTFMRKHASEFDPNLIMAAMTLPLAQFTWIIEYASPQEWAVGQISARAVVDATASLRDDTPLWFFHNRERALLFERKTVGAVHEGLGALELQGMAATALSRMTQNLRKTSRK
ncbi:MAG TPA: hypothetical protein VJ654_00795 [Noviherbaspirillum sp.]|nr:hypothetical protein [Noviherbaspirillum sp.]